MSYFYTVLASAGAGAVIGYLFGNAAYQGVKHAIVTAYQDTKHKLFG